MSGPGSVRLPLAVGTAAPTAPQIAVPFELPQWPIAATPIDQRVAAILQQRGLSPANPCSDEVFLRRAYLDAIGTLPDANAVRDFLADRRPDKRAVLVESLLQRDEFAGYWAMKWCDLLRVKSEFPINLWPNAVQAYHRWIRDSIRDGKPYTVVARELLTSSGSNFRVPPVNFYRAIQGRTPAAIAEAVALTLMGSRIAGWPADRKAGLEALFSRVAYKKTEEWKEEIVYPDPAKVEAFEAVLPDGSRAKVAEGQDPRDVFADWLLTPGNPWFARSIVNRVWSWLLGRGIIHEPDDIRPDNPPTHPDVLTYLEGELVKAKYDLRQVYRLVLNSQTYQQSSIPQSASPDAEAYFAHYAARRLDAEVLIDALCAITGTRESYSSPIPEPFTYVPDSERTIELADGSITSPFLELFGRPSRDTGLESERSNQPTDAQRLHLLNSSHIQKKIEGSWKLRGLGQLARTNPRLAVSTLYATVLSRYPTPQELAAVEAYVQAAGAEGREAGTDVVWALINTKEFLYRH